MAEHNTSHAVLDEHYVKISPTVSLDNSTTTPIQFNLEKSESDLSECYLTFRVQAVRSDGVPIVHVHGLTDAQARDPSLIVVPPGLLLLLVLLLVMTGATMTRLPPPPYPMTRALRTKLNRLREPRGLIPLYRSKTIRFIRALTVWKFTFKSV